MPTFYGLPSDGTVIPEQLETALAADIAAPESPIGGAIREQAGLLRPEDYGAVGDGVNDDTAAFQAAANAAAGRPLTLTGGKQYVITTVNLDARLCRGVIGNQAWVKVTSGNGFNITGTFTSAGGLGITDMATRAEEFQPCFDSVRIQGPGDGINGVGIRSGGTIGLSVVNCYLADLKTCIEMVDVHRNLTVSDTTIYHSAVGIHFNGGDIHQVIIADCNISNCGKAIYSVGSAHFNTLITGCDIETSSTSVTGTAPTHLIHIVTNGAFQWQEKWTIVGNQIEDHNALTVAGIEANIDTETRPEFQMILMGNSFANINPSMVRLFNVENTTIVGNTFQNFAGYPVYINGNAQGVIVADNVFDGETARSYQGGVIVQLNGTKPSDIKIAGNTWRRIGSEVVNISGAGPVTSLIVDNNSVQMNPDTGAPGTLFTFPASKVRMLSVTGNHIYARAEVAKAITIGATPLIGTVKDNAAIGGDGSTTAFTFPAASATFHVADNVGWIAHPA